MLQESLRLFVQAQLNNVGNSRVVCGITAGILCILAFCIPPLVVNFVSGHGRWARLAALPGMLLGLTIIVAAFNGICMGVYVFGDLRQLHKFELARPPISKPRPLSTSRQRSAISCSISSLPTTPVLPLTQPPRLSIIPPPQAHLADRRSSRSSSLGSESTSSTSSGYTPDPPGIIDISTVQYDTDAVDGPATSPVAPESRFMFSKQQDEKDTLFTSTATFIHPYDFHDGCDYKTLPEERQPLSSFDFDALPSRHDLPPQYHTVVGSDPEDSTPHAKSSSSLRQLLGRLQEKCSVKWRAPSAGLVPDKEKQTLSRRDSFSHYTSRPQNMPPRLVERDEATVRRQWKMVKAVPAFTELTHVLSPVIVRGQWEIVTKSFVIAILLSWLILGCLLAVPIR
jgi:hypothetical protein